MLNTGKLTVKRQRVTSWKDRRILLQATENAKTTWSCTSQKR